MEAPEVPLEHLHEQLEHHAEHAGEGERWVLGVAVSSAIIAGLAAIASLLAGVNANEAMIDQMRASDQWSLYQAKGVKWNILNTKLELLAALGKAVDPKDKDKLGQYKAEQEKISEVAKEKEKGSAEHLETHETFARSVTLFQVAIAVAAMGVLTRRRFFWYLGLLVSVGGVVFLGQGLVHMRAEAAVASQVEASQAGEKPAKAAGHERAKEETAHASGETAPAGSAPLPAQ